jgi:hypothetical protein
LSVPHSFVKGMRRKAGRAKIRSAIYWSLFGLVVLAVGCSIPFIGPESMAAAIVSAVVLGAVGLFLIVSNVKSAREGNPLDLQLRAAGDPEEVANQIELDFSSEPFRAGRLYLSPRWLCYVRRDVAIVRRIDSLVWAYLETVRHKIQGIIPYRTTHQLILWDRTGRGAAIILKKRDAEPALASLQAAAPWMFFGYTEVLKESWNNDRDDLVALVDQRRKEGA